MLSRDLVPHAGKNAPMGLRSASRCKLFQKGEQSAAIGICWSGSSPIVTWGVDLRGRRLSIYPGRRPLLWGLMPGAALSERACSSRVFLRGAASMQARAEAARAVAGPSASRRAARTALNREKAAARAWQSLPLRSVPNKSATPPPTEGQRSRAGRRSREERRPAVALHCRAESATRGSGRHAGARGGWTAPRRQRPSVKTTPARRAMPAVVICFAKAVLATLRNWHRADVAGMRAIRLDFRPIFLNRAVRSLAGTGRHESGKLKVGDHFNWDNRSFVASRPK
jgi:hypothetical protein